MLFRSCRTDGHWASGGIRPVPADKKLTPGPSRVMLDSIDYSLGNRLENSLLCDPWRMSIDRQWQLMVIRPFPAVEVLEHSAEGCRGVHFAMLKDIAYKARGAFIVRSSRPRDLDGDHVDLDGRNVKEQRRPALAPGQPAHGVLAQSQNLPGESSS